MSATLFIALVTWTFLATASLGQETRPATEPASKPATKVRRPIFQIQQVVEAKRQGKWILALVNNRRQGDWYLVTWANSGGSREWVEWWRIRPKGSTVDIPDPAEGNGAYKRGDNPPRADAGEMPLPPPPPAVEVVPKPSPSPVDPPEVKPPPAVEPVAPPAIAAAPKRTRPVQPCTLTPVGLLDRPRFTHPLTPPVVEGRTQIVLDDSVPEWTVPVDPPTDPLRATEKPIELDSPGGGLIHQGRFAISFTETDPTTGAICPTIMQTIDLQTGETSSFLPPLDVACRLRSISPSGKRILTGPIQREMQPWEYRIDVWDLDPNAHRHVMSFEPERPKTEGNWYQYAGFVNDDVLYEMTLDLLRVWQINGTKLLWECKFPERVTGIALTPGRKQIYVTVGNDLICLEALTGKFLGKLVVGQSSLNAISPHGTRLVVASAGGFVLYNLQNGQLIARFPRLAIHAGVTFVSERYMFLGTTMYDLDRDGSPIAQFKVFGHWYVFGDRVFRHISDSYGGYLLHSTQLPHAAALEATANAKPPETLLGPGDKVALDVNITASEADRKAVIDVLTRQIEKNGWVLDPAADIRIIARTEDGKSETRTFRSVVDRTERSITVTEKITRCAIEKQGVRYWSVERSKTPSSIFLLHGDETLEQAMAEASKPDLRLFRDTHLPTALMKPIDPATLPTFTWDNAGLR